MRRTCSKKKGDDPLMRDCSACGALAGQGCKAIGKDSKPLVMKAARLVHADRLKETETHA